MHAINIHCKKCLTNFASRNRCLIPELEEELVENSMLMTSLHVSHIVQLKLLPYHLEKSLTLIGGRGF